MWVVDSFCDTKRMGNFSFSEYKDEDMKFQCAIFSQKRNLKENVRWNFSKNQKIENNKTKLKS